MIHTLTSDKLTNEPVKSIFTTPTAQPQQPLSNNHQLDGSAYYAPCGEPVSEERRYTVSGMV